MSFFTKLGMALAIVPSAKAADPPPPSEKEMEAQRMHLAQKARLREAIDARKKIKLSVSNITEELGQEK